jgi:hypothetical protein
MVHRGDLPDLQTELRQQLGEALGLRAEQGVTFNIVPSKPRAPSAQGAAR